MNKEVNNNRYNDLILAISLGSKSSAMLTRSTGDILFFGLEEKTTHIKNDSSFPVNCIYKSLNDLKDNILYQITITLNHSFNSNNSNRTWDRYYTDIEKTIETLFRNSNKIFVIKRVIEKCDLHDNLAESAVCFSRHLLDLSDEEVTVIVSNRFGNFENVVSIYKWKNGSDLYYNKKPVINKLKDFKYSISMMQQIASKCIGLLEYDMEESIMSLENDFDIKHTSCDRFEIYNKQDEWYKHDNYSDKSLYDNNGISSVDIIDRAMKKSNDIYDNRPFNVKKVEQLNSTYETVFKESTKEEIIEYVQDASFTALSNLIKPHIKGKVLLAGDSFMSSKINIELQKKFGKNLIISEAIFDYTSMIGSTNKLLESIYYNYVIINKLNIKNII